MSSAASSASSSPLVPTDEGVQASEAISTAERCPVVPSTTVVKGTVLVTPLPVDLPSIYTQMIHRFFPEATRTSHEGEGKKSAKKEDDENGESLSPVVDSSVAPNLTKKSRDPTAMHAVVGASGDSLSSTSPTMASSDTSHHHLHPTTPLSSSSSSLFSKLDVINNDGESAILLIDVNSKEAAKKMFSRLHNARVCGRRWKVQYMRASELQCNTAPCLVECTLIPPVAASLAEEALASIPGFLAIAKSVPATMAGEKRSRSREESEDGGNEVEVQNDEEEILVKSVLASFCDEGSALHARAVLSGRLVGRSGARMFVKCRPPPSSSSSSNQG